MSIKFTCDQCDTTHLANDRFAGRRVRCPRCESPTLVPEIPAEVAEREVVEESIEAETMTRNVVSVPQDPPVAVTKKHLDQPASSAVTTELDDEDEEPVLPRKRRPDEEMDMTPMVDVTFLLLIFFMVTAAFSLQKSIEMPRQQTDAPSTSVQEEEVEELDMVELQVDEFGSFLVMAPEWERETPGKQNLISALKDAIEGNTDGMRLVVKVHELAKLKALVDAMDAGTIAGYAQLEVMQVEDFD